MLNFRFLILFLFLSAFFQTSISSKTLMPKVRVYIIKTLEKTLSQVEKEAIKQVPDDKQDQVKNSTLKLQNYIEDVVLAYGKEVVIYPEEILGIIVSMAKNGNSRNEISTKLREYMESKI